MYDRILFPTDGSEPAVSSLEYALDVASAHDATVHVLNVADTNRDSVARVGGEVVDALEQQGEEIVTGAAVRAAERGVSVVSTVLQGDPYRTIVDYGEEADVDLIVMPTHGRRGLERLLLGSVTERVLNTTKAPVITVTSDERREPTYPVRTVLVSTDGSDGATEALREAIGMATATGASLHVLHVVETGSLGLDARSVLKKSEYAERADGIVAEATGIAEEAGLDDVTGSVVAGRVHREIRSYVDEHEVDLVAIGKHGRTEFGRYLPGSVTAKLVRTSPVPLLTVGDPTVEDGDDGESADEGEA